jgi:3-methyladenine DNA glycosylase AlkD
MYPYLQPLEKQLKEHANVLQAEGAKAYMLHQFDFYGLKAEVWRKISKDYFKRELPSFSEIETIIKDCWQHPKREMQYFGIELLACFKKEWQKETISIIEFILTHKSWWETVDHTATELTGPYFKKFPLLKESITRKWNRSKNIWLQRSSIMFQKKYKEETNTKLLSEFILHCSGSKEFFVQKAIGWALREYSKSNKKWVKQFVQKNSLSPLSEREALKLINQN